MTSQGYRWYGPGILKLFTLPGQQAWSLDRLCSVLNPGIFEPDMVKRILEHLVAHDLLSETDGQFYGQFNSFSDALQSYRPPDKQSYIHQLMLAGEDVIEHVHPKTRSIDSTILALDKERYDMVVKFANERLFSGFAVTPGDQICYMNLEFYPLTQSGGTRTINNTELPESNWMRVAFRELILLHDFQPTTEWAAKRLFFPVSQDSISNTMEYLVDQKAIELDSRTKTYRQVDASVTSGPLVPGESVIEYHKTVMKMTDLAGQMVRKKDFKVTSQIFALSSVGIAAVIGDINQFIVQLLKRTEDVPKPKEVYQLNLQFFPITRVDEVSM